MIMLKQFEVSNYKNFKDTVKIDFSAIGGYQFNKACISNEKISKMLIYGRNATGKTNLGNAILDIAFTIANSRRYRIIQGQYINADSEDNMVTFKYTFQFDGNDIIYQYRKTSEIQLYDEEFFLNGQKIFYCNFESGENIFEDLDLLGADTVNINRYQETMNFNQEDLEDDVRSLPFLRWVTNNTVLKETSILLKLDDYVKKMMMVTESNKIVFGSSRGYASFFRELEENEGMKEFEEFLNIMGVECRLVLKYLPEGDPMLYFKHRKLVPFIETASSGTLSLMNLYRRIRLGKEMSFIYMDEFDAFYHYEMSEKVIKYLCYKYPLCQIIMTTHNTNLMTNKLMRPDCLLILSRDGMLTALNNATSRELREGHNLEKMYISGEFDAYE